MPFSPAVTDRERDKFVENPSGETSVRVLVSNESGSEVPVTGSFGVSGPTGPFKITPVTITDTASNPVPTPLTNRVSVSIRNLSATTTVYFGSALIVTPDNAATGGWDIGPGEDFHLDLDDSNLFYMIAPSGESAVVKILEIASNGGGGGSSLVQYQEVPSGAIPGNTFTLSQIPAGDAYVAFYVNGELQTQTVDYTISSNVITTTVSLTATETVNAIYWK